MLLSKSLKKYHLKYIIIVILSGFIFSLISLISLPKINANNTAVTWEQIQQLEQQSEVYYQQEKYGQAEESLKGLIELLEAKGSQENLAIALTNLGRLQFSWTKPDQSLKTWQKAMNIYLLLGKPEEVKQLKIYQSQAFKKMGFMAESCSLLIQVLNNNIQSCQSLTPESLEPKLKMLVEESSNLEIEGWQKLGSLLRVIGQLNESEKVLGFLTLIPIILIFFNSGI